MSIFVSVGKLIKNGVVDGYSITFFTELDFQGTCPLNAHVECRASLALISYIGEVVAASLSRALFINSALGA